jgi:hypothetical protein
MRTGQQRNASIPSMLQDKPLDVNLLDHLCLFRLTDFSRRL